MLSKGIAWDDVVGPPDDLLGIRFADANGLKRASVVRVSGVTVGRVEQIEFQSVGNVLVSVNVSDKVQPKVDATALQPPSIASFTIFSGSKYIGFGANDAPPECSIP